MAATPFLGNRDPGRLARAWVLLDRSGQRAPFQRVVITRSRFPVGALAGPLLTVSEGGGRWRL